MLRTAFGDVGIEDMTRPFFDTSSNLTGEDRAVDAGYRAV